MKGGIFIDYTLTTKVVKINDKEKFTINNHTPKYDSEKYTLHKKEVEKQLSNILLN